MISAVEKIVIWSNLDACRVGSSYLNNYQAIVMA